MTAKGGNQTGERPPSTGFGGNAPILPDDPAARRNVLTVAGIMVALLGFGVMMYGANLSTRNETSLEQNVGALVLSAFGFVVCGIGIFVAVIRSGPLPPTETRTLMTPDPDPTKRPLVERRETAGVYHFPCDYTDGARPCNPMCDPRITEVHHRFVLLRDVDETGISGDGYVAQGVKFFDGTCVLRWRTRTRTTAVYASLDDLIEIHGHGGATRVVWIDTPPTGEN